MTAPEAPPASGPEQVETTLFRALAVLRLVLVVYVVVLNAVRWREFERPVLGWAVVAVIVAWSGFVTWAYDAPARRRTPLLVADVAVAMAAVLSTPLVQSEAMLARHASTMASFWVVAAVLAVAVARGWTWGLPAAVAVSLCDLAVRSGPNGTTWGNIFLLLLAASIVGYTSGLVREATDARARAERAAAAMQERARLARVVHDGVLQVLALVQRRGLELGGEMAELGALAGEQEVRLRALVQGGGAADPAVLPAGSDGRTADLCATLAGLSSRTVAVSGPAHEVRLPVPAVAEVASVVRACLDNVRRHVGEQAPAWVLVEDLGDAVLVSVRDEGDGIAPGRLEEARAEGRLGVSESIRARMADLGGSASLHTAPGQGTEWELSLPKQAARL